MRPQPQRICCVWVPRFGLSVATRLASALLPAAEGAEGAAGALCALYRPGTRWQELLECSPALERAGVLPGLPLKEAQARVPDAAYLPCDGATLAAVARAFEAVVEALDAFSPTVEPASVESLAGARAVVYLDVAGLELLYGPEPVLAERLAEVAAAAAGGGARAGIASSKFAAWVAASLAERFQPAADPRPNGRTPTAAPPGAPPDRPGDYPGDHPEACHSAVVPPGEEALFLAPLPLETLPLPLPARLALQRLGVRTLGAYARLPANAVAHRYGTAGRQAHLLAQGRDESTLCPRLPKPAARVEIAFDWEESELDRLSFALKMLADQLAVRLQAIAAGGAGGSLEPPDGDPDFWPEDGESDRHDPEDGDPRAGDRAAGDRSGRRVARTAPAPSPLSAIAPAAGAPHRAPVSRAAGALRVTWRLSGGEERTMLLRLAEPSATAATFAEHLRWHAEGLDRFLSEQQGSGTVEAAPGGAELTYEPIDGRRGVVGIALEAVGIQLPASTQLKLLATPLCWSAPAAGAMARLDPVTRSRYARRAIARLQARWGPEAVRQVVQAPSRLPERAFQAVDPAVGVQLGEASPLAPPAPPPAEASMADDFAPLTAHPPLWLLDPPEPVSILVPRKGGRRVLSRPTVVGAPRQVRILRRGGPWRLVDPSSLSTREPLRRDYYQLETEDGRACLVYREPATNAWFLQGVFD